MHNPTFPEWLFLIGGVRWTIALSVVGIFLGGVMGFVIALARTSPRFAVLRGVIATYIGIFQGTPLLLQLFVTYYGLALMGLDLSAWVSVACCFTLYASAFLGEIWRGSIDAIPKGQTEAATALGISYWVRMRKVILPQALRISLPATVGFLVQLIKGTSLAAIVGFTELTRSGTIVANQTFTPLLVYGVVGVVYFGLCWPLSIYGSRLEARMAVSDLSSR